MTPTEGGSESSVPPHGPLRQCRECVPAAGRACRSDSEGAPRGRRGRRGRRRDAWSRVRTALLALLYVVLLGGSQLALAAALPSRTLAPSSPAASDASSSRRLPWTSQPPQTPAVPAATLAAPRGQQRRPPRPPSATPASAAPNATPAAAGAGPRGRGFSQSSLTTAGRGGGAWCASEDAGARAYAATTVFEGKARSRSAAGPGGVYSVTFVVQHVYKDAAAGVVVGGAVAAPPLRTRSQVRLQFVEPPAPAAPATPGPERPRAAARHLARCEDLSRLAPASGAAPPRASVRASVKSGNKFIVFADRVGPHNFTVRGAPVPRSRAAVHAIRTVLCRNCVKPPAVWGLRDVTVRPRRRLKLVCRTQGAPQPAVLWYKDGARVGASRRVRIQHNRRKSSLVIARVRPSDAGRYECKAVSVIGRQDSVSAAVSVQADSRQDNTTTLWPLVGGRCFFEQYCLNGGTCTYYETIGELVCRCAEGFKGQRCENKDVINRGSMYRPLSYFCNLGVSNTYYC